MVRGAPHIDSACADRPRPRGGPATRGVWSEVPPPVVLIGMHRSGTSLAAGMLAALGAFLGSGVSAPTPAESAAVRRSGYGEDGEFFRLNELILRLAGASWDRIDPLLERRGRPGFDLACLLLLRSACRMRLRHRFLVPLRRSGAVVWGWKDPRTSLTLPYWLRLFPDARVVHVQREPEAVAASLNRRAREWAEAPREMGAPRVRTGGLRPRRVLRALASVLRGRPSAPLSPDPCTDLGYCRVLAQRYVDECRSFRSLGPRYLELRYEDLLSEPAAAADRLRRFSGCTPTPEECARAAALAQSPRIPTPRQGAVRVD